MTNFNLGQFEIVLSRDTFIVELECHSSVAPDDVPMKLRISKIYKNGVEIAPENKLIYRLKNEIIKTKEICFEVLNRANFLYLNNFKKKI